MTRRGGMCAKCYGVGGRNFWPYLLWYLSDDVAFGKRAGICREMQVLCAVHCLADGRDWARETVSTRELRYSQQTPGRIILSMPLADLIPGARRTFQTAIISLGNLKAFDTLAAIASERLAAAQRLCFFFPSCAKGAFVLLLQQRQQSLNAKLLKRRPGATSEKDKTSVHILPMHANSSSFNVSVRSLSRECH